MHIRRSLLAALATLALGLLPAATAAQAPAPMQFAPAGTRLTWQITEPGGTTVRTNTVGRPNGQWPTFVRGTETQVRRWVAPGCWGCAVDTSFDEAAYMALWPLRVGKTVTIVRQSTVYPERRWQDVIRVARTETVTVPAGQFQTFVIETESAGLHNAFQGTLTEWWAPAIGWSVKSLRVESSGQRSETVLTAHQRP